MRISKVIAYVDIKLLLLVYTMLTCEEVNYQANPLVQTRLVRIKCNNKISLIDMFRLAYTFINLVLRKANYRAMAFEFEDFFVHFILKSFIHDFIEKCS